MVKVNVATLKAKLSKFLDLAQKGEAVIVTSHGQEIAKMGPPQMVVSESIDWRKFFSKFPPVKTRRKGIAGSLLICQMRDED